MLIHCQNCGTSYQIDPSTLGPAGRSVRCAHCQHVWFTANTAAMAAIARTHREEMAAFAATTTVGFGLVPPAPSPERPQPAPEPAPEAVAAAAAAAEPPPMDEGPMVEAAFADTASPAPPARPDLAGDDQPVPLAAPVAVVDAPSLVPLAGPVAVVDAPSLVPPAAPEAEDIESVAARRARHQAERRRLRWPIPAVSTAVLALIALDLGLIAWRAEVVRWLPQTASLYAALRLPVNLRGLVFANVTTETETHEGVQVLVVEGTIASASARVVEVPRLRFAVRDASGNEIYTWTALPAKSVLAPGATLAFRSRLASPPRETRDLVVRFFSRRDVASSE
jgi:predicted Zn finger-like uncharacterized protein